MAQPVCWVSALPASSSQELSRAGRPDHIPREGISWLLAPRPPLLADRGASPTRATPHLSPLLPTIPRGQGDTPDGT